MVADDVSFTDLIASSIHDMKNSLNLQVSALEGMAAQCRSRGDESLLQDLGRLIYQSHRMNLNLVGLLSLYKLDKSIYPLDMGEHNLAELIEEALLQNQAMLAFKGIAVSVDCPSDCYAYLERELVKGALINGLNNAYQYTRDRIHVQARSSAAGLELRVEDNGPGYPARLLSGPLGAQAVDFDSGSTGLGFYFCQQVAGLHKNGTRSGQLRIENGGSLGGGCFVLQLP